jgi:xeroderma pigmentosum group C-complementing protein
VPEKAKYFKESSFPVYWVEAFNEAHQKWVPVDPLVTKTVDKALKLEPPASDPDNALSYVVALEHDGVVRDVTLRYAKAFNAKTRKTRLESVRDGERWWQGLLKFYGRRYVMVRFSFLWISFPIFLCLIFESFHFFLSL